MFGPEIGPRIAPLAYSGWIKNVKPLPPHSQIEATRLMVQISVA